MNHRTTLFAAGLLGATGVAFGAFGAHALREFLVEQGMTSAWDTAARYQLLHAVALFAAGAWQRSSQGACSAASPGPRSAGARAPCCSPGRFMAWRPAGRAGPGRCPPPAARARRAGGFWL